MDDLDEFIANFFGHPEQDDPFAKTFPAPANDNKPSELSKRAEELDNLVYGRGQDNTDTVVTPIFGNRPDTDKLPIKTHEGPGGHFDGDDEHF